MEGDFYLVEEGGCSFQYLASFRKKGFVDIHMFPAKVIFEYFIMVYT